MNKKSVILIFAALLILLHQQNIYVIAHKMHYNTDDILDPNMLKPFMFTEQITGYVNILQPTKEQKTLEGQLKSQQFIIEMKKTKQQLLPKELFNQTTIYAYGGMTQNGYVASFPGPAVIATRDVPVRITWRNLIEGKHILPVDYNYPFMSSDAFRNQVPAVPHVHGVATLSASDGQPQAYWTITGAKTSLFKSLREPNAPNEAIFEYPNEQQASNNWYHDHTMGITRLNVYAGLAGLYKIVDPQSIQETKLLQRHGNQVAENQTKYLVVTDKTFKTNGELFYPDNTDNPSFTSWVPQFFGNTILVNGVVWPKMTLKKGKHRFVILNACQNRYLNIYFENSNKKIPMELIRIDGDYYDQQIIVTEHLATLSSRIEFILDLTLVKGEVILKNNADAPYPMGDPENLDPQFTGQLMKIAISTSNSTQMKNQLRKQHINQLQLLNKRNHKTASYPFFSQGEKVFATLFEITQNQMISAMFIDGVSMSNGKSCMNSTYQIGKTYDFYIINLTPDSHPIHFHLINLQKVKQFNFDVNAYEQEYFKINGGVPSKHGFAKPPIPLNPEQFRTGDDEYPLPYERIFRDTIDCHPEYVTVLRVKFARNDGSNFKTLDLRNQRFVWHCHMLEHEDNEMMKYYCLK